jgi:hypothetical protein
MAALKVKIIQIKNSGKVKMESDNQFYSTKKQQFLI